MRTSASTELDFPTQVWPRDGRLARPHAIAVGRRLARGELPLATPLHAIADVVCCATPGERAEMLAAEQHSEEDTP